MGLLFLNDYIKIYKIPISAKLKIGNIKYYFKEGRFKFYGIYFYISLSATWEERYNNENKIYLYSNMQIHK